MLTRFEGVGLERVASHLPPRVVTTKEMFPNEAADLERLTGIRARHVARDDQATSDLAVLAARDVIGAGPIDRVILATASPDHPTPPTAPLVQHTLGLPPCPAFDLGAACAGFVYAVDAAARAVLTGDTRVLVVAAESKSRALVDAAPGVRALFGDGACAATVARGGQLRLDATLLLADGSGHGLVRTAAGGSRLPTSAATVRERKHVMAIEDGAHVFFSAVEGMTEIAQKLLDGVGLAASDVAWFVPHQANLRILERVQRLMDVPAERMVSIVGDVANVGGASAGIALASVWSRLRPGERVLLFAAGAGFSAGAALFTVARNGS